MTIEYIEKRIESKNKEIAKLEKKLSRIMTAKESNWEKNPYYYGEDDLRWTVKDIENAKKDLETWKDNLTKATEMAESRNVEAITNFLNDWEARTVELFLEEHTKYLKALDEYRTKRNELREKASELGYNYKYDSDYQKAYVEIDNLKKDFVERWNHVMQFDRSGMTWEESMKKAIANDKNAKYDHIIAKTNSIVGKITDASNLYIGMKGDINGFIIGERGKASVRTIDAGGYNIQCYHFRTLIHEYK